MRSLSDDVPGALSGALGNVLNSCTWLTRAILPPHAGRPVSYGLALLTTEGLGADSLLLAARCPGSCAREASPSELVETCSHTG